MRNKIEELIDNRQRVVDYCDSFESVYAKGYSDSCLEVIELLKEILNNED